MGNDDSGPTEISDSLRASQKPNVSFPLQSNDMCEQQNPLTSANIANLLKLHQFTDGLATNCFQVIEKQDL